MSAVGTVISPGLRYGARPQVSTPQRIQAPGLMQRLDEAISRTGKRLFRRTARYTDFEPILTRIRQYQDQYSCSVDEQLRKAIEQCRQNLRLAATLDSAVDNSSDVQDHLLEALALLAVQARRSLGLTPYPEQLFAAWCMRDGFAVEMLTGEGKTLCAALAASLAALQQMPVHIVTVNDYLVGRDSRQLQALYTAMGISVSAVTSDMDDEARRKAYACDVVYVTGKQLAFDYLRDRSRLGIRYGSTAEKLRSLCAVNKKTDAPLLGGLCFAIIDEMDSILIDEARTPLILASSSRDENAENHAGEVQVEINIALGLARLLHQDVDFTLQRDTESIWLTEAGLQTLRNLSERFDGVWKFERYRNERIRQALTALHLFRPDKDYVVREGRVVLIDESTGRLCPDRRLQNGLHQFLELRERCELTPDNVVTSSISFQHFFNRFHVLAGMSGSLQEVAAELQASYSLDTVLVPSHQVCRRQHLPVSIAMNKVDQYAELLKVVADKYHRGQPVLIGTRTVEQSELISALLAIESLPHQVLNARQDSDEASIVARAGQFRAITVATNMAGRGTDIPLTDKAAEQGGIHVIALFINDSRRIDRQLVGRAARQGDPGSSHFLLSLDDPMVEQQLLPLARHVLIGLNRYMPLIADQASSLAVRWLQYQMECRHARQRREMLRNFWRQERQLALGGLDNRV